MTTRAIQQLSTRIYEVVHSMMQRVRPGTLDDLGLVDTLQQEVDACRTRYPATRYELRTGGDLSGLGERINISLSRGVRIDLTLPAVPTTSDQRPAGGPDMNSIRVLICDDHEVVRAGYQRLLESTADIRVVAQAASGEEACRQYLEHRPEVVVMDLSSRSPFRQLVS